ncbi:hypothetical protein Tco_1097020 [Tanacetum coccineum]
MKNKGLLGGYRIFLYRKRLDGLGLGLVRLGKTLFFRDLVVISESAASLSSISSALNNAESAREIQEPEPQNAEMNADMPLSSSSQRSVATTVVQVDNLSTDSVEIDLTVSHPSSSSSRRTTVSRALSLEGGTSRELRRDTV